MSARIKRIRERMSNSLKPADLDRAASLAVQKLEQSHAALRAALEVMVEADKYDRAHQQNCPNCQIWLDIEEYFKHHASCPRVSAIRLVREALGE